MISNTNLSTRFWHIYALYQVILTIIQIKNFSRTPDKNQTRFPGNKDHVRTLMNICNRWMQCILDIFSFDYWVNTMTIEQIGRYFADDIFKRNFPNENICILIKNCPTASIDNQSALV